MKNSVVWAITAVLLAAIGSLTLILITIDKSQVPEGWLAIFVGFLGTVIGVLVTLFRVGSVETKVDEVGAKADRILNGEMEGKIEKSVAAVLGRHGLIDNTNSPT